MICDWGREVGRATWGGVWGAAHLTMGHLTMAHLTMGHLLCTAVYLAVLPGYPTPPHLLYHILAVPLCTAHTVLRRHGHMPQTSSPAAPLYCRTAVLPACLPPPRRPSTLPCPVPHAMCTALYCPALYRMSCTAMSCLPAPIASKVRPVLPCTAVRPALPCTALFCLTDQYCPVLPYTILYCTVPRPLVPP